LMQALGQLDEAEQAWVPWAEAMIKMTEQEPSPPDEDTVPVGGDVGGDAKNSDSKGMLSENFPSMSLALELRWSVSLLVAYS